MDNENKIISCINCGKIGHISKKCIFPIISIGVICIKYKNININNVIKYIKKIQNKYELYVYEIEEINKFKKSLSDFNTENFNNSVKYLLIRRRSSLNYVEFIRGKYSLEDLDYLKNILNFITDDEKQKIISNDFHSLWIDFWDGEIFINSTEYNDSKNKFDLLRAGFINKKNDISIFININILLDNAVKIYKEPEWGFPKGRRNIKEKNVECGKREFSEETNIKEQDYNIINICPFEETFMASNNNKYKHIYYIGQVKDVNINPYIDKNNKEQIIEISSIDFFNFNDAFNKIRDYDIERRFLLINLNNTIKNIFELFLNEIKNI